MKYPSKLPPERQQAVNYDTKLIIPYLALITAFCCYIPIILGYELVDLDRKQQSEMFERAIVGATSCAFPLVLDVIMNFDLPKQFVISRWLFLSSLVIPNVLMLSTGRGNTLEIKFILCSNFCRQILVVGGLLNCLHCQQRSLEICRNIFYTSACITMILGSNFHFVSENSRRPLLVLIFCFGTVSFLGISFFALAYLWQLFHRSSPFTTIERYCGVLACLLFLNHFVRIFFQFPLVEYSTSNASHKSIVDTVSAVLGFILPSRIAIENAALSNVLFLHSPSFTLYSPPPLLLFFLPSIRFSYPRKRTLSVMSGVHPVTYLFLS
jgi:hypothetical protein